mmetsp:Transcript_19574/g.31322  ORF Transcript_19574/g.31322 Transcript_19574/m.31322 type:complete len:529 (-) Transcript_19574:218-1804(-)
MSDSSRGDAQCGMWRKQGSSPSNLDKPIPRRRCEDNLSRSRSPGSASSSGHARDRCPSSRRRGGCSPRRSSRSPPPRKVKLVSVHRSHRRDYSRTSSPAQSPLQRLRPTRSPRPQTCERSGQHESSSASSQLPRALFLMGLPGAGKSTVKRHRLQPGDLDVEPDKYKCRHRRYSEDMSEETDEEVHRWSVRYAVSVFEDAVRDPRTRGIIFDSSGSNASWLKRRIELARDEGFMTQLLWVDVPKEVAVLRNRNRGSERDMTGQFCPEKILLDKADVLEKSFEELSRTVDFAERLPNWSESSGELEAALEDLYLYPAPRIRPPVLRPGGPNYGKGPDGARTPSPTPHSRRILRIGPWKRSDSVTRNKNRRLSWMDRTFKGNREQFVSEHVLGSRNVLLERNRFPYQLPPGIEHWTIWNRIPMDHEELCNYVEGWLDAREPHNVVSWNYDDNLGRKTIDVWHVHVYFQGKGGLPPRLTCPSSSKRRYCSADNSDSSEKRRCQRGLSTATTKAPSSPSRSKSKVSASAGSL